jgi:hypothetical protein
MDPAVPPPPHMKNPARRTPFLWEPRSPAALRAPFDGADGIAVSFSQSGQDIFVLSALGGKRNGAYLEIGAAHPVGLNNSCLLSGAFGWKGVSLDLDAGFAREWLRHRPADHFQVDDATAVPYADALPVWFPSAGRAGALPERIDYLQLDIDPSFNTLKVLRALPLDHVRFSVITFETDIYAGDPRARAESRARLEALGYVLVAGDVSVVFAPVSPDPIPFEDWWVDPQVVDRARIASLLAADPARRGGLTAREILFLGDA